MARLNICLADIQEWMADNFLNLNDDESELILIGNPKRMAKLHNFQLQVIQGIIQLSHPSVRAILGYTFIAQLSFKTFINETAASAMYPVRTLAAIRDHLPRERTSRLCTSLVISRFDNCNSVLSGFRNALCTLCNLP